MPIDTIMCISYAVLCTAGAHGNILFEKFRYVNELTLEINLILVARSLMELLL